MPPTAERVNRLCDLPRQFFCIRNRQIPRRQHQATLRINISRLVDKSKRILYPVLQCEIHLIAPRREELCIADLAIPQSLCTFRLGTKHQRMRHIAQFRRDHIDNILEAAANACGIVINPFRYVKRQKVVGRLRKLLPLLKLLHAQHHTATDAHQSGVVARLASCEV